MSDIYLPRRRCENLHIFNILETVTQIANERVINMLEHSALPYNIAHALRADDCSNMALGGEIQHWMRLAVLPPSFCSGLTFIFANVF